MECDNESSDREKLHSHDKVGRIAVHALVSRSRLKIEEIRHKLVGIQTRCLLTEGAVRFYGRRLRLVESTLLARHALARDADFIRGRRAVTEFWERVRAAVGCPEQRGLKYLAREMHDLDARLRRQRFCLSWGIEEDVFVCACALTSDDDGDARPTTEHPRVVDGDVSFEVVRRTMQFSEAFVRKNQATKQPPMPQWFQSSEGRECKTAGVVKSRSIHETDDAIGGALPAKPSRIPVIAGGRRRSLGVARVEGGVESPRRKSLIPRPKTRSRHGC